MGKIKGAKQYDDYLDGKELTRKDSMLAKCYECNGEKESAVDCEVGDCPLYPYHHYRQK